jgi:cytochrome c peroxidase
MSFAIKFACALVALGVITSAQSSIAPRRLRLPATSYRYVDEKMPRSFQTWPGDNTPADNQLTDAGAALGRVLFYDTQLSGNNTRACASCHLQQHAFADPHRVSSGFDGRLTDRHAMNLTNLRFHAPARFFWDERSGNLEQMVLLPVSSEIEMGQNVRLLPGKLAAVAYYPELFRSAFGDPQVTEARISRALAQFLRSLTSYRSRYDEGLAQAGSAHQDFATFTRQENRGKALFVRHCATCHLPADDDWQFTLLSPANNGVESDPIAGDGGVGDITLNALDLGRFKSPTLRNVEVAGPYMHDGSLATLDAVIDHYSRNFRIHPNLDFRMAPLHFTDSEKLALVAFLKTLTDHRFLTDARFSDPFEPRLEPMDHATPASTPPAVAGSPLRRSDLSATTMLERLMRFDGNGDGMLSDSELIERMREIVPRGDANRDGTLDAREARALASASPVLGSGIGLPPQARRLTIRTREPLGNSVPELLGDLKLPRGRLAAARVEVAQTPPGQQTVAGPPDQSVLLRRLEHILTADELNDLRAALERR